MSERVKVVIVNGVEYLMIEETEQEKVEFRLYYDNEGNVLFYTCDKPEGNFIIVDKQTYVEARLDWKIVDGKLTKYIPGVMISKLKPSIEGISCHKDDINIVTNNNIDTQKWKLHTYELR